MSCTEFSRFSIQGARFITPLPRLERPFSGVGAAASLKPGEQSAGNRGEVFHSGKFTRRRIPEVVLSDGS